MAFPTVPNTTNGRIVAVTQANTTATRTFPAFAGLTFGAGDLLVAVIGAYQSSVTNAAFSGWSSGFTEIRDASTSTTSAVGVAYKVAAGTESGSLTVTQAATITGHADMVLFSIPAGEFDNATAPEVSTTATGANTDSDPDALTPSWGAADTLWAAVSVIGETSLTGAFQGNIAGPANYTDYLEAGISGDVVGGVAMAVAFRQLNAATEDPPAFNSDTSNARWRAATIAIRPVAASNFTRDQPDTAALTDPALLEVGRVMDTQDAAALTDPALLAVGRAVDTQDAAGLTDPVAAQLTLAVTQADVEALTDATTVDKQTPRWRHTVNVRVGG